METRETGKSVQLGEQAANLTMYVAQEVDVAHGVARARPVLGEVLAEPRLQFVALTDDQHLENVVVNQSNNQSITPPSYVVVDQCAHIPTPSSQCATTPCPSRATTVSLCRFERSIVRRIRP